MEDAVSSILLLPIHITRHLSPCFYAMSDAAAYAFPVHLDMSELRCLSMSSEELVIQSKRNASAGTTVHHKASSLASVKANTNAPASCSSTLSRHHTYAAVTFTQCVCPSLPRPPFVTCPPSILKSRLGHSNCTSLSFTIPIIHHWYIILQICLSSSMIFTFCTGPILYHIPAPPKPQPQLTNFNHNHIWPSQPVSWPQANFHSKPRVTAPNPTSNGSSNSWSSTTSISCEYGSTSRDPRGWIRWQQW